MVTRRVLGGWREASFEQQPFTSFIVDWVDRQKERKKMESLLERGRFFLNH